MTTIERVSSESPAALADLQRLLRAYADHVRGSAGEEHICLQSYEVELLDLPRRYRLLLLARVDGNAAGCVLLKAIDTRPGESACEMKRLWVDSAYRSFGLGKLLIEELLGQATASGFSAIYLDTIPNQMPAAFALYRKLGFTAVPRYNENHLAGVQFLRRELSD